MGKRRSPSDLPRGDVRRSATAGYASKFHGVAALGRGDRWVAQLILKRVVILAGVWPRESDAALACDQARIHFGLAPLNFREEALRLGGAKPELLRKVASSLCGTGSTSKFFGVRRNEGRQVWGAVVREIEGHLEPLGEYRTEEEAAVAFDRVALGRFGNAAVLNFPSRRATKPATAAEARRSRTALPPPTSRYAGVDGDRKTGTWRATYYLATTGKTLQLGKWGSEREAARARDRAASYFGGSRCHLNFPEERRALEPASDAELRHEADKLERLSNTEGRLWREGGRWLIRYQGRTMYSATWAKELGITREGLRVRLFKSGWTVSDALSPPSRPNQSPKKYRHRGKSLTVSEWAEVAGMSKAVLDQRLRLGWPMKKALETEVRSKPRPRRKRRYRGVTQNGARWSAKIMVEGVVHHLGSYDTERQAALAYDRCADALRRRGGFRNFPEESNVGE